MEIVLIWAVDLGLGWSWSPPSQDALRTAKDPLVWHNKKYNFWIILIFYYYLYMINSLNMKPRHQAPNPLPQDTLLTPAPPSGTRHCKSNLQQLLLEWFHYAQIWAAHWIYQHSAVHTLSLKYEPFKYKPSLCITLLTTIRILCRPDPNPYNSYQTEPHKCQAKHPPIPIFLTSHG